MARTITGADSFAAVYFNGARSPGIARIRSLRRRPHRSQTKHLNRERRELRQLLVHAAGCTHVGDAVCVCADILVVEHFVSGTLTVPTFRRPVSVPRSLRPLLGRWVGGGR